VKLNLGCGDKILPGCVNVDVAPTRAGQKPDVICDLHKLEPFQDAAADEILAVHVVEHFWRGRRAARVGARAQARRGHPESFSGPGPEGQRIRQEPAQFKLREPRDMRIVGSKR
jgi:hypothetical protein